jgi:hypothetical protein
MITQLTLESVEGAAPPQSTPAITEPLHVCPVRDKCLVAILAKNNRYRCGWEQVRSVWACPKRRGLEG